MLLCWISRFFTTWRMWYSTRLQARWSITSNKPWHWTQ